MRFRVQVGRFRESGRAFAWWEEFEKDTDDPDTWAEKTIERFNETLRPGERPRFVVQTEVLDTDSIRDHDWEKTNLVTIMKHGSSYDAMRCRRCGITGKRYGLGDVGTTRDHKFRATVYLRCDTSLVHRRRLGAIRA